MLKRETDNPQKVIKCRTPVKASTQLKETRLEFEEYSTQELHDMVKQADQDYDNESVFNVDNVTCLEIFVFNHFTKQSILRVL